MGDTATVFQGLLSYVSVLYNDNKAVVSFIGGALAFGIPHAYRIYKFFADRRDMKDRLREQLVEDAHRNRALLLNASNVFAEIKQKANSGIFYAGQGGVVNLHLATAERSVIRPALDASEELYRVLSEGEDIPMRSLEKYKIRIQSIRHTSELALAGIEARMKELGVLARLL